MAFWTDQLLAQLDFHWEHQLRPRLAGLSDAEYFWEPVPDSWSLRPGADGRLSIDWAWPAPQPAPVTTIGWRLSHVIVSCLAMRSASHFGAPAVSYDTFPLAATAREALAQLESEVTRWRAGVLSWGDDGLLAPCGPAEGPYANEPRATLVLHIHRELIHHLAEVSLLRDLYAHTHQQEH